MAEMVSRVYSNFRGVDFRSDECILQRSPDGLNMWKDYKKTNSICTRPSLKQIFTLETYRYVYSISFYRGMLMVHHNTMIYAYELGTENTMPIGEVLDLPSQAFVFNGVWYFKQQGCFKCFDFKSGFRDVMGYVPTTSIGRKPSGGGTIHQDVNMLTTRRINTFVSDGESKVYHLDSKNLPQSTVIVKVNDVAVTNFTVNFTQCTSSKSETVTVKISRPVSTRKKPKYRIEDL